MARGNSLCRFGVFVGCLVSPIFNSDPVTVVTVIQGAVYIARSRHRSGKLIPIDGNAFARWLEITPQRVGQRETKDIPQ
jgi:hypothetical protein